MIYGIALKCNRTITVEVEAKSLIEAIRKAREKVSRMDGCRIWEVDEKSTYFMDENSE